MNVNSYKFCESICDTGKLERVSNSLKVSGSACVSLFVKEEAILSRHPRGRWMLHPEQTNKHWLCVFCVQLLLKRGAMFSCQKPMNMSIHTSDDSTTECGGVSCSSQESHSKQG